MYYFFVTGVTFFSNIKSFYEILFLDFFFFSTCSQFQKNNENAGNKEIVSFI